MEKMNRIGEVIKEKGITQKWLAKKVGKSTNAISAICRNESQPKLETLYKTAEVLNISVCKLLITNSPSLTPSDISKLKTSLRYSIRNIRNSESHTYETRDIQKANIKELEDLITKLG